MAAAKLAAAMVALLALLGAAARADYYYPGGSGSGTGGTCFAFEGWARFLSIKWLWCSGTPSPPPSYSPAGSSRLSVGYYNEYCHDDAEKAVWYTVKKAIDEDPGMGAGLIRIFFHDCFVRGCDASVLLETTPNSRNNDTEMFGPPNNNSLRGFEVIQKAKEAATKACGGNKKVVSCADIVAFAARDAADILSGGKIKFAMPAGRLDGRESFASETGQLPGPDRNVQQLEASFAAQGLDRQDMVTLSGAHSIGRARCLFLTDSRLASMENRTLAAELRKKCPKGGDGNTKVNQDNVSPDALDNQYYKNVQHSNVLFDSDATLTSSDASRQLVNANAQNADAWGADFARAMVKMGYTKVKTARGNGAEIREVCSKVN